MIGSTSTSHEFTERRITSVVDGVARSMGHTHVHAVSFADSIRRREWSTVNFLVQVWDAIQTVVVTLSKERCVHYSRGIQEKTCAWMVVKTIDDAGKIVEIGIKIKFYFQELWDTHCLTQCTTLIALGEESGTPEKG